MGQTLLSLDPVSSSYRETAAFHLTLRGRAHYGICDFFCVRIILFQTLYVFFVLRDVNREILHIALTPCPTTEWNGGAERIIVQCYPEQSFALNSLPFVCDKIDSLIYFRAVRELRLDLSMTTITAHFISSRPIVMISRLRSSAKRPRRPHREKVQATPKDDLDAPL